MALKNKKLVSVIILGDIAPYEQINEQVNNVLNQTYKSLDIIISIAQNRNDITKFRERWNSTPNLRIIETGQALEIIKASLAQVHGDYVFYKSVGPVIWMPCHIEHHVDLFQYDQKAKWSFSFIEYKNLNEQQQPTNILSWRIEQSPGPQNIIIDELCHVSEFNPDWDKFLKSFDNGKTVQFFPGACLEIWKPARVAVPQEITVQMWVDPRPVLPEFGKPQSDQNVNEEVIEGTDGQLEVKIEFPTLVGSSQWDNHNKLILNRIQEVPQEKINKIALKRTIGMGDVILVEPVIKSLRKKYPNAEITLFTSKSRSCADIVQYFVAKPDITIGLDGESWAIKDFLYEQKGYDIRIDFDLAYESRKNINYIDTYFRVAGFKDEVQEINGALQVINSISESEKVPSLIYKEPRLIQEKYVSVELGGSGWPGKEWDVQKWDLIIEKIKSLGYSIAVLGNFKIPASYDYLNKQNDFNIMLNYLKYCDVYIGADNGCLHVANGFSKYCFVVAGAALPSFTTKGSNVYQCVNNLQCLHCKGRQYFNQLDQGITFVSKCENTDQYACMKKLQTNYVLEEFNKFYANIQSHKLS